MNNNLSLKFEGVDEKTHRGANLKRASYVIVGAVDEPTAEAKAAYRRIQKAVSGIAAEDLRLIAGFSGNLVLYPMVRRERVLTDEERHQLEEDAKAQLLTSVPGATVKESWMWGMGSDIGVSVLFSDQASAQGGAA